MRWRAARSKSSLAAGLEEAIGGDEHGASPLLRDRRKCRVDLIGVVNLQDEQLQPEAARRSVQMRHISVRVGRINEHGNEPELRHEFAQQLQSFRIECGHGEEHPGGVAARPVEGLDEAHRDRVETGAKDERDAGGLDRQCNGIGDRADDGDPPLNSDRPEAAAVARTVSQSGGVPQPRCDPRRSSSPGDRDGWPPSSAVLKSCGPG